MVITQVAPKLNLGMRMIPIQPGEFIFQGVHGVRHNGFKIAQTPFTNEQFQKLHKYMPMELKRIVNDPQKRLDGSLKVAADPSEAEKCPMVLLSWDEFSDIAKLIGKRLLTELEWERAASYIDGRDFSWGCAFDPKKAVHNYSGTKAVKKYSAPSPEGVYDLTGNVREVTNSFYGSINFSYSKCPTFPAKGALCVVRGGSFGELSVDYLKSYFRNSIELDSGEVNIGCRFAEDWIV
jgi:formylglycine-generating enzyme required for sulfatase activity